MEKNDVEFLRQAFAAENYICDDDLVITVGLALKLGRPLLVEGAPGVGKTEIAKVLATALETELIRLQWARQALGDEAATLQRASVDAGHRSYWRSSGRGQDHIVMDSPPGLEDVRPWLQMRDLLEQGGVRVPQVLSRDVEAGFLLLEDL